MYTYTCKECNKVNNYERIKSMSIKELALFLDKISNECCTFCAPHIDNCEGMFCYDGKFNWLSQDISKE